MRISVNQVKKYIDVDLPPINKLEDIVNNQLGVVEETIDLNSKYKDAVIVSVVECIKHPDADKLSVTKIDDGGVVSGVPRDENGLVQVVCGAPNARAGILAVWLPPKSTVPVSFGDDETFVLEARKLRGVLSQGMLAANDELDLGSDHEGIVEIDVDIDFHESNKTVKPGDNFAELFGLNDTIIDIENKMFTHRPDCFGQLGVAREISAILQGVTDKDEGFADTRFVNPDWYWMHPNFEDCSQLDLDVYNNTSDKVPRFMAVAMSGVKVRQSPMWLRCELVAMGVKPINNVVDATNYIMLITAQPTHAYDYNKLSGKKLGPRMAVDGEKVKLLDGNSYTLSSDDIVIADAESPVALGGIMGGFDSQVDDSTTDIVLECATFDMYSVRKTSMRSGIFTDALTRFNKGQSKLQNDRVLFKLMDLMTEVSGAKQTSKVSDVSDEDVRAIDSLNSEIKVPTDFINSILGSNLTTDQAGNLLRRVNFASYSLDGDSYDEPVYTPPFWRTDISIPEDIVEEIGRLYGFDKLPRELPVRSIEPAKPNKIILLKKTIRNKLSNFGANEILTYSFVHENLLKASGQDINNAYKLSNALSPDLQYYRLSVIPSILSKVHLNIKQGFEKFALFEMGVSHSRDKVDDDNLPEELEITSFVYAASDNLHVDGAPYYQAKVYLENLVGNGIEYKSMQESDLDFDLYKPYNTERSAIIYSGDRMIGVIGEFNSGLRKELKLPKYCAGFELFTESIVDLVGGRDYSVLSKYPKVDRDITVRVSDDAKFSDINNALTHSINAISEDDFIANIRAVGVYKKDEHSETKNYTFNIEMSPLKKTFTSKETNEYIKKWLDYAGESIDLVVI